MKTNETTAPILAEKDRNAVSLELMNRMKLHGMAAAFTESLSSTFAEAATPDSFLNWLLSREWDYRSEAAIQRLIRMASFRYKAYPEEIDYTISRGLDRNQMERLASLEFVRCPLLILDDLFLVPLDAKERPILLDVIEDRHGRKSIIITSQVPVSNWYDAIGDPTVADAILDRIVHSAHQIELTGESVRKIKAGKNK